MLLVVLFAGYAMLHWRSEYRRGAPRSPAAAARAARSCAQDRYTMRERMAALPRVLPFLVLLTGVMVALYGGIATPERDGGARRACWRWC